MANEFGTSKSLVLVLVGLYVDKSVNLALCNVAQANVTKQYSSLMESFLVPCFWRHLPTFDYRRGTLVFLLVLDGAVCNIVYV